MVIPEWLRYLYCMASWLFFALTVAGLVLLCMKRNEAIKKQLASVTIFMALFFLLGILISLTFGGGE